MKLKILYFSRDYSPHDERFLTALGQTAHEINFLRLAPSREIELPAGIKEVKFTPASARGVATDASRADELKEILAMLKPDVLHAGPLHGPGYIAALSRFSPLASMSWGADILHDAEVNPDDRRKIDQTLQRSTVFIGDNLAVVEKAVSDYGFPLERVFRFPWGVDLAHFSPAGHSPLREQLGWQDNFVFLSNRSFEDIYGVDVILRAFIEAEKHAPEIRLLLYGRGSREAELRRMADSAGLTGKIHFGAFVGRADLPASYNAADVFLSASHCDGSSVSLMEALACGKPAIVSDIPGNREWVSHSENGWIFQDGDSHELAALMLTASRDLNLAEMGEKSRLLAEDKADWSRNFPVLLEAYEKASELRLPAGSGGSD